MIFSILLISFIKQFFVKIKLPNNFHVAEMKSKVLALGLLCTRILVFISVKKIEAIAAILQRGGLRYYSFILALLFDVL